MLVVSCMYFNFYNSILDNFPLYRERNPSLEKNPVSQQDVSVALWLQWNLEKLSVCLPDP